MIEPEPQRDTYREVHTLDAAFRIVLDDLVQEKLAAQHAEHELMTERAIRRFQLRFFESEENGRERAVSDAAKDFESRATRR